MRAMTTPIRCAFLSTDDLEGYVVDDDRAYPALRARGVVAERVPWRARVAWSDFDVVVVRSPWDYHRHSDAFFAVLAAIDASPARLANPLAAMRWNLRKTYLEDLRRRGVAIVPTTFGQGLDEQRLQRTARTFDAGPWVIKPVIGANAGDVFRLPAAGVGDQGPAIVARFCHDAWMAQPFVDSVTHTGEYSLFYFDGRYSHAVLKTPRHGDFRVQEEHGGKIRALTPVPALRAAADRVCAALPSGCLYVRVDLVALDDAFAVMEVELIEPSLYLRMEAGAPARFADALLDWLARRRGRAPDYSDAR
jgi:glutathione synthase/RimK-type ligase-like ATP-grasp enzyme